MIILHFAFHRKFLMAGISFQFAFAVIDRTVFQYLPDFSFIDMPAFHPAPGMPGIMYILWMAV